MSYVEGFVLPVPKKNMKDYKPMAQMGLKMWKKYGVLDYKECVGDDMKNRMGMTFPRMVKPKPGETIVFSYIVYRSRALRDSVNAKMMKDMKKYEKKKGKFWKMKEKNWKKRKIK